MAQHDYVIANGSGAAVRSDLNNALAAIVSNNSGATEPSTTYAYMPWADTTTGLYKIRNAANSGWITLYQLDGEWSTIAFENGTAAAPSIYFKDSGTDTGFYSPGTDQVGISTGGTARLTIDSSGNVNIDSNTLYVDAANNRVGLGTSSPSTLFQVKGNGVNTVSLQYASDGGSVGYGFYNSAGTELWSIGGGRFVAQDALEISRQGSLKFLINSSGNVGIGTSTVDAGKLHILNGGDASFTANTTYDALVVENGTSAQGAALQLVAATNGVSSIGFSDSTRNVGQITYDHSGDYLFINTAGSERARIDDSGRLLISASTALTNYYISNTATTPQVQIYGTTTSTAGFSLASTVAGVAPRLHLASGASGSSPASGDAVGSIHFSGHDGTNYRNTALIQSAVDGTPGSGDMPGRLIFSTTADGAASPTERMRLTSEGRLLFGKTTNDQTTAGMQLIPEGRASFATNGSECIFVNRNTNDGNLIELAQAGTIEGTISVSGTTVSYNGAHLSRWSQLPGGAERTEILRGTVLSNIDEMCDWGEEENEQLNRMKVSDVEGDSNVAGVFQAWDDDDDTYTDDFYCAMTGDFIIRIAEGVTVQRGDLLMSAGDGTAKPQDDDIIRSKTIAKVTSTHITCTYEDGSYCVPCVLMAC